jgi:hypothetical protein
MLSIVDLPTDIICETTNYLNFVETLHFSHTCKRFYELLNTYTVCNCLKSFTKEPSWELFNNTSHVHSIIWEKYKQIPHKYSHIQYTEEWRIDQAKNLVEFVCSKIAKNITTIPSDNIDGISLYDEDNLGYNMDCNLEVVMHDLPFDDKLYLIQEKKYEFSDLTDVYSNGIKIGYVIRKTRDDAEDFGYCLECAGYIYTNLYQNFPKIYKNSSETKYELYYLLCNTYGLDVLITDIKEDVLEIDNNQKSGDLTHLPTLEETVENIKHIAELFRSGDLSRQIQNLLP